MSLAFWRRSLVWSLIVIIAVSKMVWGVMDGDGSGWIMLAPALEGLVICDAAVLYAAHEIGTRATRQDRHELRMVQKR